MTAKNIILIIIIAAIVVILVVFGFLNKKNPSPADLSTPPETTQNTQATGTGNSAADLGQYKNIAVPEKNSKSVPSNIAVPEETLPIQNSSLAARIFSIEIKNDKFIPDTIIVNLGDIVKIKVTAIDKNYDFSLPFYGLKYGIEKGKTGSINFSVSNRGQIPFFCESCGGPDKGPVGNIVVK